MEDTFKMSATSGNPVYKKLEKVKSGIRFKFCLTGSGILLALAIGAAALVVASFAFVDIPTTLGVLVGHFVGINNTHPKCTLDVGGNICGTVLTSKAANITGTLTAEDLVVIGNLTVVGLTTLEDTVTIAENTTIENLNVTGSTIVTNIYVGTIGTPSGYTPAPFAYYTIANVTATFYCGGPTSLATNATINIVLERIGYTVFARFERIALVCGNTSGAPINGIIVSSSFVPTDMYPDKNLGNSQAISIPFLINAGSPSATCGFVWAQGSGLDGEVTIYPNCNNGATFASNVTVATSAAFTATWKTI